MSIEFQKHIYRANEETGYFDKVSAPVGFIKLPAELKLEKSIRPDYHDREAKLILRSRIVKNKYSFFTGLLPTGFDRWYFGDHYHPHESIKNSFCLFRFNDASSEIVVYYFNHFKLYPGRRGLFISQFIQSIQQ